MLCPDQKPDRDEMECIVPPQVLAGNEQTRRSAGYATECPRWCLPSCFLTLWFLEEDGSCSMLTSTRYYEIDGILLRRP